jgi:hypothetical protein
MKRGDMVKPVNQGTNKPVARFRAPEGAIIHSNSLPFTPDFNDRLYCGRKNEIINFTDQNHPRKVLLKLYLISKQLLYENHHRTGGFFHRSNQCG